MFLKNCFSEKYQNRASQHGWELSDLHRYCDNKGTTITIIMASKVARFGGFISASWKFDIKNWAKDGNTFNFSLMIS